jgi:hypothetical protein
LALIIRLGALRRRVLMEGIFLIAGSGPLPSFRGSVCPTADAA